jgi:hypothetical protein
VTIGGSAAPAGTLITARITGAPDATTTVDSSGNYNFQVPADDPDTPVKEGGVAGDTIQFSVDTTAAQTSTFAYGGITNLDLGINTTPPSVTTDPATAVTTNSATLNGDLTNKGTAGTVDVSFKYGTTAGGPYPNQTTPIVNAPVGPFSTNLGSLTPNTTYYYVAYADGGVHGTTQGTQQSFTTGAPSPPAAPNRQPPSVTLKWSAPAGATKYWLQVNTKSSFKGTDLFNADVGNVTSYELTNLPPNKGSYYWRVKAGNAAGWSAWSSRGRFYYK